MVLDIVAVDDYAEQVVELSFEELGLDLELFGGQDKDVVDFWVEGGQGLGR